VYTAGMTVKPRRRGASPSTLRGTNPDCSSRFSTVQTAQRPVRGHGELASSGGAAVAVA
jgi:hypothetical protein